MQRGTFIVIEGPDGSGTTRHSSLLAARLRQDGSTVLLTSEPTDSKIGQEIRSILHSESMPSPDAVQLLFCADRADHVASVIEPALERGDTVVCDRYVLSTIIYGAAFGLDRAWLEEINAKFPKPDLTIITLPPYEVCLDRISMRGTTDHFERDTFQRIVYDNYKNLEDPNIVFVDTTPPKEEVADEIYKRYQEHFGPISRETIADLG